MAESSGKKRKIESGAEEDEEIGGKKAVRMYASACQFCRRRKVSLQMREAVSEGRLCRSLFEFECKKRWREEGMIVAEPSQSPGSKCVVGRVKDVCTGVTSDRAMPWAG